MPRFLQTVYGRFRPVTTTTTMDRAPTSALGSALGLIALACVLSSCSSNSNDPNNPTLTVRQTQQWSQSCALCHVTGVGGAPVVGDSEQWRLRLEQGQAQLLAHTLEGYANMPPLGYCMSCETEDFEAMIAWMSRTNP